LKLGAQYLVEHFGVVVAAVTGVLAARGKRLDLFGVLVLARAVLSAGLLSFGIASAAEPPRAARSVHLGWMAPEGDLFYLEMVVERTTAGSYFMACGWNTGYYGIQQLEQPDRKVAIFSVWDPTRGDDAAAVKPEDRVEVLYANPSARIKRFGGEGTGGQCMMDFAWEVGQTNRFLVRSRVDGSRTAYTGYLWMTDSGRWQQLVTFRTRTDGQPLRGYYSFIEDFRRDGKSVHDLRRARFGNGWVRTTAGHWVSLNRARFTASSADWESKDNINAGLESSWLYLATGGEIRTSRPLGSVLERPIIGLDFPEGLDKAD
jgi:hypothetical protein